MGEGFELIGIHHVQLAMPDGEDADAVAFYADTLGLIQVPRPEALSPRGGVWFVSGDLEVHLGVEDQFRPAVKAHPAILVKGLGKIRTRIEDAGYKISDTVQIEGFDRVYVRDPFGNRLELIEAL
ncbi:MAG: VOC family protein [Actinomycetota bacterium]|nr:VOC family protein [Actinomycetota bacterium]